jgi:hypothetical protein
LICHSVLRVRNTVAYNLPATVTAAFSQDFLYQLLLSLEAKHMAARGHMANTDSSMHPATNPQQYSVTFQRKKTNNSKTKLKSLLQQIHSIGK